MDEHLTRTYDPNVPSALRATMNATVPESFAQRKKKDADYVFYELTRSICPEHGSFEGLVYGDASAYKANARFNKPGTIPLAFSTEIKAGKFGYTVITATRPNARWVKPQ